MSGDRSLVKMIVPLLFTSAAQPSECTTDGYLPVLEFCGRIASSNISILGHLTCC